MTESMKAFLEAVSQDKALQTKLSEVPQLSEAEQRDAILSIASELGIALSKTDFAGVSLSGEELSDEQMEDAAGGITCATGIAPGVCICFGQAERTDQPQRKQEDTPAPDTSERRSSCIGIGIGMGETRCMCVLAGSGEA